MPAPNSAPLAFGLYRKGALIFSMWMRPSWTASMLAVSSISLRAAASGSEYGRSPLNFMNRPPVEKDESSSENIRPGRAPHGRFARRGASRKATAKVAAEAWADGALTRHQICIDSQSCANGVTLPLISSSLQMPISWLGSVMSSAIELIVDGFAKLKDRQWLENLRMHRRRLAVDLKARTGFDYRSSIAQVEQDTTAIEPGLQTLSGPIGG